MTTQRLHTILCLAMLLSLWGCYGNSPDIVQKDPKMPPRTGNSTMTSSLGADKDTQKNSQDDKKLVAVKTEPVYSRAKQLIQQLGDVPISIAPLDMSVLEGDTSVQVAGNLYGISYITSCLNDSLVAQEIHDHARQYQKGYLLSHNYQTDIAIKVNGKPSGKRNIRKSMFAGKIDADFLAKSIIKHPHFIRFDEARNEAVFEFVVGVPNTDWLVVAGVQLSPQGEVRIINIFMPEMQN